MASITGATATYQLGITGLYNAPQYLQGFAADDVFSTPGIESAETMMGVDGYMSAGFVFVVIKQTISIQADSSSNNIFDQWWSTQQQERTVYFANATVVLNSLGVKWNMRRGVLSNYSPIPDVKKLIQPRKFEITWNSMSPAPV